MEFLFLENYFDEHDISHQTSIVGTPQQNGQLGHKRRHILNVVRALQC